MVREGSGGNMGNGKDENAFTVRLDDELMKFLEKKKEERMRYNDIVNKAVSVYKLLDEFSEKHGFDPERFVKLVLSEFEAGNLMLLKKRDAHGKA